ncbi:MAG: hypothetical protein IJD36_03520 [Clostridia bacterium]|nr:hypothetical protein [Clostridia bacterium]
MNKKILCGLLAALAICSLSGCKNEKEVGVDYYEIGYEAIAAKHYETALDNFLIAAEKGDEQARDAAKIVSGYLDAKEAFEKEEIDKAKEILSGIPGNYKYYAIGEDIDTLRRTVYQYQEKKDDAPELSENDQDQSYKVNNNLSAEKAAEYLRAAYPDVEGDVGDALVPQFDENGTLFYSLTIQLGEDIKTIHILEDGAVQEIDA